ncbi:MAG: tRNA (adenine22-N1)-methyltransferase [Thermoanaerobacteraceae bacterium]|jgi:tRNA (adenine22-N1)-methyltransferase|nr:tRNA (adenine22-N1)-methyltransferase [Thermoanaerobacteraceae bacterium]
MSRGLSEIKMKVHLNDRLLLIAGMIPRGHAVADIGTDHAYLPIYLIKEGISTRVIATEITQGPFKRALENVKKAGLEDFIELRHGPGLKPLAPGEVQTAVIAGMGGDTIAGIIRDSRPVAGSMKLMLLQPMRNQPELRRQLFSMGFKIIDEDIAVEDSRFYEIIAARRQSPGPFDDIDIAVGPVLRKKKTPIVYEYIQHKIEILESLINPLKTINTASGQKALAQYQRELEIWKEVLQ